MITTKFTPIFILEMFIIIFFVLKFAFRLGEYRAINRDKESFIEQKKTRVVTLKYPSITWNFFFF